MIPVAKPFYDEREVSAVAEVLRSGWISHGPAVERFEHQLAAWVGAKYAVGTNSCTSALQVALHLAGIGAGDEVICPSFTCMASANAILQVGARPRFVEVDPETFNMAPTAVEAAVGPDTRGMLIVHQIGLPACLDELNAIAERHRLRVVEDAGCALGASYQGRRIGSGANPVCFSFHPRKTLSTGEGGMLVTSDRALAERARVYRSHGVPGSGIDRHRAKGLLYGSAVDYGHNFRLTDIQGALGSVQMDKLDAVLAAKAVVAAAYTAAWSGSALIRPPVVPPGMTHAWQSYLVLLDDRVSRDAVLAHMSSRDIMCLRGINPLHQEPYFERRFGRQELAVTERLYRQSLFLPIYPAMSSSDVETVIAELSVTVERLQ